MSNIQISKVTKADIPAYANIIREELGFTLEEACEHLNEMDLANMLKIDIDGSPIGFINFTIKDGNYYINDFDIEEKQRRNGYGSQLLEYFEKQVIESGCKKVWLHVNINNKLAIKFYEKNGFVNTKRIADYYAKGYDAFVMEKLFWFLSFHKRLITGIAESR